MHDDESFQIIPWTFLCRRAGEIERFRKNQNQRCYRRHHTPADRQIILLIYSVELEKLKNLFPVYCNGSGDEKFILVLIMTSLEQERSRD